MTTPIPANDKSCAPTKTVKPQLSEHNPAAETSKVILDQDQVFDIMHFNIQGLSNKCDSINILLTTQKMDIICLDEHWLKKEELEVTVIKNYKLISSFTRTEHERGGRCIFIREELEVEALHSSYSIEKDFEVCIAKIRLGLQDAGQ
ncbi:hypothetical protein JTB14_011158 [Gonioctena quinquepunctata]|nr:hypothetical protein JTB14_011158 [Gonioctena quinquepunctata]